MDVFTDTTTDKDSWLKDNFKCIYLFSHSALRPRTATLYVDASVTVSVEVDRLIGYRQKSMPIVFCVASVAGVVENDLLSLYSMRAASGGGNL